MPKQRYERREPTHEWSRIRPLLKDPTQIQYEILRPVVLFGISPIEHATAFMAGRGSRVVPDPTRNSLWLVPTTYKEASRFSPNTAVPREQRNRRITLNDHYQG